MSLWKTARGKLIRKAARGLILHRIGQGKQRPRLCPRLRSMPTRPHVTPKAPRTDTTLTSCGCKYHDMSVAPTQTGTCVVRLPPSVILQHLKHLECFPHRKLTVFTPWKQKGACCHCVVLAGSLTGTLACALRRGPASTSYKRHWLTTSPLAPETSGRKAPETDWLFEKWSENGSQASPLPRRRRQQNNRLLGKFGVKFLRAAAARSYLVTT